MPRGWAMPCPSNMTRSGRSVIVPRLPGRPALLGTPAALEYREKPAAPQPLPLLTGTDPGSAELQLPLGHCLASTLCRHPRSYPPYPFPNPAGPARAATPGLSLPPRGQGPRNVGCVLSETSRSIRSCFRFHLAHPGSFEIAVVVEVAAAPRSLQPRQKPENPSGQLPGNHYSKAGIKAQTRLSNPAKSIHSIDKGTGKCKNYSISIEIKL